MADRKLTELDAAATLAGTDLLYVVTDPAGTPTSRKATLAQISARTDVYVSSDYATIQAAVDACATAGGGVVYVPAGTYVCDAATFVRLADNVQIQGAGRFSTLFEIPDSSGYVVFDADGVTGAAVRDCGFTVAYTATTHLSGRVGGEGGSFSTAVRLRGNCEDIHVERIRAAAYGFAVWVNGSIGGVGANEIGECRRIVLRDIEMFDALQHGIDLLNVDGCLIENVRIDGSALDCLKIARLTRNVTVRGGYARSAGPGGAGIDAYAGGDLLLIDGFVAEYNYGFGIVIKSDNQNDLNPSTWGMTQRIIVANCRLSRNGGGLSIHRNNGITGDDPDEPLMSHVLVSNIVADESSTLDGIFFNARQLVATNIVARGSARDGIRVDGGSFDVAIHNAVVTNNGLLTKASGDGSAQVGANASYDGIKIKSGANRITITNVVAHGHNRQLIARETDYTASATVTAADAAADTLTIVGHRFGDWDRVEVTSSTVGGLAANTYYVVVVDDDTIQLRPQIGSTQQWPIAYWPPVDVTSTGTATLQCSNAQRRPIWIEDGVTNWHLGHYTASGHADDTARLPVAGGGIQGFYGTAPVAQQTGVPVTAAGIHVALVALGLITA